MAGDVCEARHPRERGDPNATQAVDSSLLWIPAFAGMTAVYFSTEIAT